MSYQEKQARARRLVLRYLEGSRLSDEELDQIISTDEGSIRRLLMDAESFMTGGAAREKRARKRCAELDKLSTEELNTKMRHMNRQRIQILEDDPEDDLPDSFFETPPIDSDAHIIHQILKERLAPVA